MSVYVDAAGDRIAEYPPFRSGTGETVAVRYNPRGFRLVPAGCWAPGCDRPARFHVVRRRPGGGESHAYRCWGHVRPEVRHWVLEAIP